MCKWFQSAPALRAMPAVSYVQDGDRAVALGEFTAYYMASRNVQADDYNRAKLAKAIQECPAPRPVQRAALEAYLDTRYRSTIRR